MRTQVGDVIELSRADSFREQAEACQVKAEEAVDPMDGQLWSLMANQWSQLAHVIQEQGHVTVPRAQALEAVVLAASDRLAINQESRDRDTAR